MQNYEFSLEFNPDIIQHIYSLIKEDPAYTPPSTILEPCA